MKILRPAPAHTDERGSITDLVTAPVSHVARMKCWAGTVRGNHYHRTATAYIYVIQGAFNIRSRMVGTEQESRLGARAGDLVVIDPREIHSLEAITDGEFLMLVSMPNGGDHWDKDETVREVV